MTYHSYSLFTRMIEKHFKSVSDQHLGEFIETALEAIQGATGQSYQICIEPLIDLINDHFVNLNFESSSVQTYVCSTFKKLLFEQNYDYTIILQKVVMKSVRSHYEKLVEKSNQPKASNLEDSDTIEELPEELDSLLISLTRFENYNQIDFFSSPGKILQIMKGFLDFGGYAYVNIGFGAINELDNEPGDSNSPEEVDDRLQLRKSIQRVVQLLDEFKQSRKGIQGRFTILDFI
mmetsp:Transcript_28538/g.32618  ORF Transcript_28538/g.32618 Transcript_28538/m.32618 type:complete len:234 (+) Transcript_28538:2293-2994(+)